MSNGLFPGAISVGVLAAASTFTTAVYALEPANFRLGPVFVAPTIALKAGYIDNLFRTEDDEKTTSMTELTPRIQAWLQNGVSTYSLAYQAVDYRYNSSSEDDYTDQQVNLDIHHEFNAKNALNIIGEYYDGHEERGTGLTDGVAFLIDEPVEYERTTFGGDYTYGNANSKGRLNLEAKQADYDFQNLRNYTQFRDREQDTLGATFFWKVGNKTDILGQVRYIDNSYDRANPDNTFGAFDSEEYNYLVGVTWEATAKTTGSVKVGVYDREYDSALRKDDDGFQWEVDVTWQPRSYSSIQFETNRFSRETNGQGDTINTEEYKVGWNHDWGSRASTHLAVRFANEDYSGTRRDDDRLDIDASYKYAPKRWLDLSLGLRREDRDSTQNFFDYTRNVYYVEAKFSL